MGSSPRGRKELDTTERLHFHLLFEGFPSGASGRESACNAGHLRDVGLIPGLGRSSGGGHDKPFQYICLENATDRSLAGYAPEGRKESDMTEGTSHSVWIIL